MKQPRFYLLGDSSANNPSAISKTQIELWESEGIIEYLGVCDDVRGIIEACDCVVLPSYKEGAPRILLEAMALHKGIITTDTAGCKECIKAPLNSHNGVLLGENGILVPLKDSLALKEAICYLCENPHLLKSMGESGAEFAKRFDVRGVVEIYKKAISNANSSLGNQCVDLAFSHKARTPSPLTLCQNAKNSTSKTADTRIFSNANDGESQGDSAKDSADSMESNAESLESSLRRSEASEAIQNNLNPHEVRTNSRSASWCIKREKKEAEVPPLFLCKKRIKARLSPKSEKRSFWRVGERGGGAALFAKKSDYVNENISSESRRRERAENAESLKDSSDSIELNRKMDCHDSANAESRNDELKMTAYKNTISSNDASHPTVIAGKTKQIVPLSSLRGDLSPKQSILQNQTSSDFADSSDSTQSSDFVDCHEFNKLNSRNDGNGIDSHEAFTTHNDDSAIDSHANPYELSRNGEHIADYHKSQGDSSDDNSMAIPPKMPDFHNGDFSQDSSHSAKSPKHSPTKALAFISNTCFGMWNFRLPVLKSLQKDGFVVHILAPTDNSRAKLENEGFFVHSISIDSKGLNPLRDIKTAMQIYKILSTIKPSVVFSYTIKCVIYGSFVANMLKIPNIAIITGLGYVFIGQSARKKILQNIVSKMYAIALRKTKSVWFLNNDDKSEFIKRHIIAESKSFLLNSEGVDLEHFSPKCGVKSGILPDRKEGEVRFILIARMLWDKGVGEFVEAARKIVDSTTAMGGGDRG